MKADSKRGEDMLKSLGQAQNETELEEWLVSSSHLPGPRANLGLAERFANELEAIQLDDEWWNRLLQWMKLSVEDAGDNEPRIFLPFCAIQALGACYAASDASRKEEIFTQIRGAMNDPRWRMREGAAMALQRIGEKDFNTLRSYIAKHLGQANMLERRAFIAALAHPPLLTEDDRIVFALNISDRIMEDIHADRVSGTKEDFRVLSKGLEYAISVFAERLPQEGFALLAKFAATEDKRLHKIMKSNLGKARIAKKYPEEMSRIARMMT